MANIPLTDLLSGGTNSLRTEVTNIPTVTNANLDIALSALRDAITKTGETVKTLADIVDKLSDVGVTSLPSLIAGSNIVGKVGIDQTTPGITNAVVNKNASGNEIFTDASPGSMKLTGSKAEVASAQDANVVGTVETYNRTEGATQLEVYCETGYIRVRTDGQPCTGTTGEPIAAGFGACWDVESVSIYYIQESIVTVVSR